MTALTSLEKLKADSHCDSLQWGASHFSIDASISIAKGPSWTVNDENRQKHNHYMSKQNQSWNNSSSIISFRWLKRLNQPTCFRVWFCTCMYWYVYSDHCDFCFDVNSLTTSHQPIWIRLKILFAKRWPFCLGLNVLIVRASAGRLMNKFECHILRADSRFAPSQWETALLCNNASHWLGASLESAQYTYRISTWRLVYTQSIISTFSIILYTSRITCPSDCKKRYDFNLGCPRYFHALNKPYGCVHVSHCVLLGATTRGFMVAQLISDA